MQLEDIIKSLWKEIEQVSDDLPFDNTVPRSTKCIEKWLDLFKEFIEDEHIRIIKDRSVAIFNRCGGKSEFKDLVPLVSKKDYPDAIDISIITFFITGLACYGVINQKELLSLQKEKTISANPLPSKEKASKPVSSKLPPSKKTIQQKYILTVVVSAKEIDLINTLCSDNKLTSETGEKLFQAKHWIYYDSEENWKKDCEGLFDKTASDQIHYEYEDDVYYIKLMMDNGDRRFGKDSTMLKMYDAFKELSESNPKIEISKRLPKRSCENKGFYTV